jgi:hypothetical protein
MIDAALWCEITPPNLKYFVSGSKIQYPIATTEIDRNPQYMAFLTLISK